MNKNDKNNNGEMTSVSLSPLVPFMFAGELGLMMPPTDQVSSDPGHVVAGQAKPSQAVDNEHHRTVSRQTAQ